MAKLTAGDAKNDRFGDSVAIDERRVRRLPRGRLASGSAYVFRTTNSGASAGQGAKLTASDAATKDVRRYGLPHDQRGRCEYGNAAYVFRTSDGARLAKRTAADADGRRIAVHLHRPDGNVIVVGA